MRITKLKYLLQYEGKGNKQSSESEQEGLYPFYSCSIIVKYSNNPSFEGQKILISTGGQFYAFLTDGKFDVSTDVLVHNIKVGVEPRFLLYFLEANSHYINDTMFNGMGIKHIDRGLFYDMRICVPDLVIQRRIATFLDGETGRIDNLVEELTKFKVLLQIQRKSLISECVIQGVPEERDREYMESGVEWLGGIPLEWGLRPFGKSVVLISNKIKTTQNRISLDMIQSGNGALSINDENDFVGDGVEFARGDVLFGKLRPYLNKSYYAESDGDAFGDIHVYRPNKDVAGKYLFYFTLMDGFVKEANRTASGVKMPRASWSNITKFAFTLPSLSEQQKIADYLDFECVKIDSLTGEIDNQINLLKTYRKSLINEVISGKVQV